MARGQGKERHSRQKGNLAQRHGWQKEDTLRQWEQFWVWIGADGEMWKEIRPHYLALCGHYKIENIWVTLSVCFVLTFNIAQQFRLCLWRKATLLAFKKMSALSCPILYSWRTFTDISSIVWPAVEETDPTAGYHQFVRDLMAGMCFSQIFIQWHLVDRLKSAVEGIFTWRKWVK